MPDDKMTADNLKKACTETKTSLSQMEKLIQFAKPIEAHRPKVKPKRFSEEQELVLRQEWVKNKQPSYVRIGEIALEIGVERSRIGKWFNNRRQHAKRREANAKSTRQEVVRR